MNRVSRRQPFKMDSVQQELVSVLDICASTGMQHVSVLTIGE